MKRNLLICGSSLFAMSIALLGGWLMRGCSERKAADADRHAVEQALNDRHDAQKSAIQEKTKRYTALVTLQVAAMDFPPDERLEMLMNRLNDAHNGDGDPQIERMIKLVIDCIYDSSKPRTERLKSQEKLAQRLIKEYLNRR